MIRMSQNAKKKMLKSSNILPLPRLQLANNCVCTT